MTAKGKGLIAWWVNNPIAANLLMWMILAGGVTSLAGLDKEMFPKIPRDVVQVEVPYPGAGPREVEEQICIRIEEEVHDLDGIEEIRSFAYQGGGRIEIEVSDGYSTQKLLNDVKSRVDAINTFPEDSERPQIKEVLARTQILSLAVAGPLNEADLKRLAETIRDEVIHLPGVTLAEIGGTRPEEVSVEISEQTLRRYQLRFEDVVAAIRRSSVNLPAGEVREVSGDIVLQTRGQAYHRADFERIVVLRDVDGTEVKLGDIATINDGFAEQDLVSRFNGKPAVFVNLFNTRNPDVIATSEAVRAYIDNKLPTLQPGVELEVWRNMSVYLNSRIDLLLRNALGGLLLVFALLVLFLRPVLAFWVAAGIGVAYVGTLWLMPYLGISVNVVSLFAFLLILGIVVDDAIVVGESVYAHYERGLSGAESASLGARAVSKPVTFAVLTTMIVFVPMLLLPGDSTKLMVEMPKVALVALAFSLLESFLILPAHLRNLKPEREPSWFPARHLHRTRLWTSDWLRRFVERRYRPLLERSLRNTGVTIALFVGALIVVLGIFFTGWLRTAFFPVVEGEYLRATVELPEGSGFSRSLEIMGQIERGVTELKKEPLLIDPEGNSILRNHYAESNENLVTMVLELASNESRSVSSRQVAELWRKHIGPMENVEEYEVEFTLMGRPKDINLLLKGRDTDALRAATAEVEAALNGYPGVFNLSSSLRTVRKEIEISLRDNADTLGIGLSDIAGQLRNAFYGAEAQRIPREREDVKVMVRYPENERAMVSTLDELRVRTEDGRELPFDSVAEAEFVPGYTEIKRQDRMRVVEIEGELARGAASANEIVSELLRKQWPAMAARYPGLVLEVAGAQKDQQEFEVGFREMMLLALLAIYAFLAVEFRSYWQPVIILSAVPFGVAGAILGHLLFGKEISMPSMMGVMAAAGVVINDNLVLIDRINQLRQEGWHAMEAVVQGAKDRFRPIVLTSLTTFFGLTPILFERSAQAQFLIPMVISLAFGVLLATFVTLLLVPAIYVCGERLRDKWRLLGATGVQPMDL
ncbi:MAG: efflux RND transporter permease subunit [Porticoccaceae bacterium]